MASSPSSNGSKSGDLCIPEDPGGSPTNNNNSNTNNNNNVMKTLTNYSTIPRSYSRLVSSNSIEKTDHQQQPQPQQLTNNNHHYGHHNHHHHHHHHHSKGDSFLMRLMRHFSLNSISTNSSSSSSSTASSSASSSARNQYATNGYLTMARSRRGRSTFGRQSSFPSSISNGDIRRGGGGGGGSGASCVDGGHSNGCSSLPPGSPVPAVTGIKNHGNTCFMNAVLQCLSNTDYLAEYFVMDYYRNDLLRRNKLHAKKYGTRGEVTEQMAALLKCLWSNEYSPEISTKFKLLVAKYGTQYDGSDQHDAQEFLLWLVDKIHEDLNVATKKKYKKFKNMFNHNRPDEIIAAETLANHMRCNLSFIHELFQAQLKSSLVCRSCGNHSNTFDPYLCLSLPVPARQTHTIIVNVSYLKKTPKEVKIGVSIEAQASLRELRDKISRLIKVPERQLVLLTRDSDSALLELSRDTDIIVEILEDNQQVEAVETHPVQQPAQLLIDTSSHSNSPTEQFLALIWSNSVCNGTGKLFGPLYSCRVSREASYKQIQTEILSSMKSIIKKDVDFNLMVESVVFRLRVITESGKRYLPEDVDHPLYTSLVDNALLHCERKDYRGPLHLKLVAEWDANLRDDIFIPSDEIPQAEVDPNIECVKARAQKANRASLSDCFDLYFREEKLAADNAWMCPFCRRRQQCDKKLSLWSVPDVFVVHLKRFRQASSHRSKISTLIQFPLRGLDMNAYLALRNKGDSGYPKRSTSSLNGSSGGDFPIIWSSWQKNKILNKPTVRSQDNVYDLYAVCNHHGNMQGGHYTAYCRNPVDRKWRLFDDHKVSVVSEEEVTTADAYILFYQRKCSFPSVPSCESTSSTSTSGYSSCASSCYFVDHWAFRMPHFHYWSPKSSRSQDNLCDNHRAQSAGSNQINRGQKIYASLPSRGHNHQKQGLTNGNLTEEKENVSESSSNSSSGRANHNNEKEPPRTERIRYEGPAVVSLPPEDQCDAVETKSYTDSLPKKYWTVTSV